MSGMALDIDTDTAKQKASVRYICSRRSKLCSRQSESELYPKTDKALFSPIRERVISKDGQSSVLANQRASYIQRRTKLCFRQSESELYPKTDSSVLVSQRESYIQRRTKLFSPIRKRVISWLFYIDYLFLCSNSSQIVLCILFNLFCCHVLDYRQAAELNQGLGASATQQAVVQSFLRNFDQVRPEHIFRLMLATWSEFPTSLICG